MDDDGPDLEALAAAAAAEPGEPVHHANLGAALHAAGRHDEAAAAHRRAIAAMHVQLAALSFNLGASLAAAGHLDEAAVAYREALRARPGWALAHHNLGALCFADGDHAAAIEHFEAALAEAPDAAATVQGLAVALTALDRLDDALAAYRRLVALGTAGPDDRGQLALLALRTGDAAGALAALAEVDVDDAGLHGLRGAALARLGRHAEAAAAYDRARALAPERVEVHYNCALAAEALGDLDGAVASYRAALAREPAHLESLANLSRVLIDLGRVAEVEPVYEQLLAADPGNTMMPHLLAGLRGETTPTAPRAYVVDLFDSLAPRFEELLVGRLGYRVPTLLREALDRHAPDRRFASALDLGCGTGLVGAALRDRCDTLTGVDLAPRMIDEARGKQLYDALHVAEVVEFLAGSDARHDLIAAADVLIYIGDLDPLIAAAARHLAPGGLVAFSVERDDAADVTLRPTGRYAHRRAYLERLAAAHGLTPVAFEPIVVRHENPGPIPGWVFLLRA